MVPLWYLSPRASEKKSDIHHEKKAKQDELAIDNRPRPRYA